jgi:hypothetical protein
VAEGPGGSGWSEGLARCSRWRRTPNVGGIVIVVRGRA